MKTTEEFIDMCREACDANCDGILTAGECENLILAHALDKLIGLGFTKRVETPKRVFYVDVGTELPKVDARDYPCAVCRSFADNFSPRSMPTFEEPWHPDCYIHQYSSRPSSQQTTARALGASSITKEDGVRLECDHTRRCPVHGLDYHGFLNPDGTWSPTSDDHGLPKRSCNLHADCDAYEATGPEFKNHCSVDDCPICFPYR